MSEKHLSHDGPHRLSKRLHFSVISALLLLFLTQWVPFTHLLQTESLPAPFGKKFNETEISEAYQQVLIESNLAGQWLKIYTQEQHLAGKNFALAQFTADKLEEFGFQSKIEAHNVYINYPNDHAVKLLKPSKNSFEVIYEPTLVEDELKEDPTTRGEGLVPAFHGYSASGNVTAPLVFANYGTKEDFALLESKGVIVKGNVVIVRYGKIFRGLKVKFAQEAGAIGVLIYSDPADDYVPEDVEPYPEGPGRNPSSIQRGSVQFLSSLPGDPSRFTDKSPEALKNLTTIPQIPSLPISYKEAEPILKQLNGFGLDLGFHGGLKKFHYTTGPSIAEVNVYNNVTYNFSDIHNVYGLLEGEEREKVIIIGNHRDAWIKGGAADPNSGSAVMLEIARALGELLKQGWKPRYSIMLASWDGEEYGLLGSTAFAEKYAEELGRQVIGYLNVDVAVSGSHLKLAASPLLDEFLLDQASKVKYPKANMTLLDHFLRDEAQVHILGSGSDYTAFYEHLGIVSADMGFINGKNDPVYHYHSNYDSYHWMSTFADPDFELHNALAQYIGLLTIHLSESKLNRAYSAGAYAHTLKGYFDDLVDEIPEKWLNRTIQLDEINHFMPCGGRFRAMKHENYTLGKLIKSTGYRLHGLKKVATKHDKMMSALQVEWDEDVSKSKNPFKKFFFNRRVKMVNEQIKDLEKQFLYEPGLNGRDWFKHIVFASGRYTGYAGQSLPGLTEALEDGDFEETARWIGIIRTSVKKALVSLIK
jgi:N-acetylated-alpha-linked acidic dipeptidase